MNTKVVKRVIAREGLIILALMVALTATLLLGCWETDKQRIFEKNASVAEVVEPVSKLPGEPPKTVGSFTGFYIMIQKPVDLIRLQKVLRRDFPDIKDPQCIEWDDQDKTVPVKYHYDSNGSRISFVDYRVVFMALVLMYPVYWLVRFVIWSIRTLRQ